MVIVKNVLKVSPRCSEVMGHILSFYFQWHSKEQTGPGEATKTGLKEESTFTQAQTCNLTWMGIFTYLVSSDAWIWHSQALSVKDRILISIFGGY